MRVWKLPTVFESGCLESPSRSFARAFGLLQARGKRLPHTRHAHGLNYKCEQHIEEIIMKLYYYSGKQIHGIIWLHPRAREAAPEEQKPRHVAASVYVWLLALV